jgi:hypothetical protein
VSFGVILALAGVALLSAVFVAFQSSVTFGAIIVGTEAVLTPLVLMASFKLLPKTKLGKELILDGTAGTAAAADPALAALLRKEGVTLTALRPAGYARIDGRKVGVWRTHHDAARANGHARAEPRCRADSDWRQDLHQLDLAQRHPTEEHPAPIEPRRTDRQPIPVRRQSGSESGGRNRKVEGEPLAHLPRGPGPPMDTDAS